MAVGTQTEKIRFCGLRLFLHAFKTPLYVLFQGSLLKRKHIDVTYSLSRHTPTSNTFGFLILLFSFLGWIIYIEKIRLLFACGKQKQQDHCIVSVSGMSKNATKKLSFQRNGGTTATGKCSLKWGQVFWNKVLGQSANSWWNICHWKAAFGTTSRRGVGQWVLQDKAEVSTEFLHSSRLHLFFGIVWVCQEARLWNHLAVSLHVPSAEKNIKMLQ